jgi:hypothetical protein
MLLQALLQRKQLYGMQLHRLQIPHMRPMSDAIAYAARRSPGRLAEWLLLRVGRDSYIPLGVLLIASLATIPTHLSRTGPVLIAALLAGWSASWSP